LFFVYVSAVTHILPFSLHDALPIFSASPTVSINLRTSFSKSPFLFFTILCIISGSAIASDTVDLGFKEENGSWNIICISLLVFRSEEHTSELQSRFDLVCRLLLENK